MLISQRVDESIWTVRYFLVDLLTYLLVDLFTC